MDIIQALAQTVNAQVAQVAKLTEQMAQSAWQGEGNAIQPIKATATPLFKPYEQHSATAAPGPIRHMVQPPHTPPYPAPISGTAPVQSSPHAHHGSVL